MAVGKMFKPASGTLGATAFKGLVDVQVQEQAANSKTRADGAIAITRIFTEGHFMSVSVRCESNENHGAFHVGMVGKLSFVLKEQAEGVGAVGAGDKTMNLPAAASTGNAVITAITDGLPWEGKPTYNVQFEVYDAAGDRTLLQEFV